MSFVLDDTWGGQNANTYITVADADDILQNEYLDNKSWGDAGDSQRTAALVSATRLIDSLNWEGTQYFFLQQLEFPRAAPGLAWPYGWGSLGQPDASFDALSEQDKYLKDMKYRVKRACAIQACQMLRNPRNYDREAQFSGINAQSSSHAGVSEGQSFGVSMKIHPDVYDLLKFYRTSPKLVRA